jgi:hypothetical protein
MAVLSQAIRDILCGPDSAELKGLDGADAIDLTFRVRCAAEDWIADGANEPRRFVWVCEQLGLDPDAVRRSIEERRRG